jgi:GTP:adenosylcobinamide-phosphate guanylyltransferase
MADAVILAGEQSIKGLENFGNKALYLINKKMMIEYVIDAIKKANEIKRIVVVGPKEELSKHIGYKVDKVLESGNSAIENAILGVKYLDTTENILICSCDIPLITTEAIDDFIAKSKELNADLCYPIIEKTVNDEKYPEMERTYVKIREGRFTGGNIFYVNPKAIERGIVFADRLIKARKNPIKMARLMGYTLMLQLIMGNLAIKRVEERFTRITGLKAKAVVSLFPEVGQDIDKSSDLVTTTQYLSR